MKFRRARDVAWRTIDDETLVIQLSRYRMYGLNAAGSRVWEALTEPAEVDRLAALTAEGETDARHRTALSAFLTELTTEGLLQAETTTSEAPPAVPATPEEPLLPRVMWCEEVERFAGACAFAPTISVICDQQPFNS
jgi:Coenzyme PQQ synthesis protein D (PqqD)